MRPVKWKIRSNSRQEANFSTRSKPAWSPSVTATFDNRNIRVIVPVSVAKEWIESDQTGIEASTATLRLLIEKDFQCLHREPEPGEDSFPNPLAL